MQRRKIVFALTFIGIFFIAALSLQADVDGYKFKGDFKFGYRFVDTSGELNRYKQDINLEKGVRLFDFNLTFQPNNTLKKFFDRLDINVYNFGGDPFESLAISVQKYGTYKFRYDRRKSTYFYADQTGASPGHLYDLHTFNFDRVRDNGFMRVWLGDKAAFYLNFDRYTKKGNSTTTLDVNRIEFEYDKPIDEDLKEFAVGLDVNLKNYTFVLEEKVQDYENVNSYFLPGFEDGGESARYPSDLSLFILNQPYDLKTYTHSLKINAKPIRSLMIKGAVQLSNMDMNLNYSEEAMGTDYLNRPFSYEMGGTGSFERDIQLYDLDVTYLLTNNFAIVGAARYNTFDQEGSMAVDGDNMPTSFGYKTRGFEGGLQYQLNSQFAFTAGYRNERRTLDGLETVDYEDTTTRNGMFGNLRWTPSRQFSLTLDHQYGSYDNPYTLISPMKFNRFRGTAKFRMDEFYGSASFMYKKSKNDLYDDLWESSKNQLNVRAGYHTKKITAFGGFALINVKHTGDRVIEYPPGWSGPAGSFTWEIMYEGKSNLFDAYLALNLEGRWKLGGYANIYSNTGFWEIKRQTIKAFVEYAFINGLLAEVAYRYVNFEEKASGLNDYKANIIELSFGYRWDK